MSEECWECALYVYVGEGTIGLSEDRVAEESAGVYLRVPALLWLGAELGVRTASLWWEAMGTRACTEEVRWVVGFRLEDERVARATESWPEHVQDALALLGEREPRLGGDEAMVVAQVLLEMSYNQAERAEGQKPLNNQRKY